MVHDALRRDVAFMNAAGVFHFDAHLGNILTDGHASTSPTSGWRHRRGTS